MQPPRPFTKPAPRAGETDTFVPSAPLDRLGEVLFGHASPTQLPRFFGPGAVPVHAIRPLEKNEHNPAGGWELELNQAALGHAGKTYSFLRNHVTPGECRNDNELHVPPLGRMTREVGAWRFESVLSNPDKDPRVVASTLQTRLRDDGGCDMALWEVLRDGSGLVYRLDGDAWRNAPGQVPAVLELYAYAAGDVPQPKFWMHVPSAAANMVDATFDMALPMQAVWIEKSDSFKHGGWEVHTRDLARGWSSCLNLRDEQKPGVTYPVNTEAHRPFGSWTRTQSGWHNVCAIPVPAEGFGRLAPAVLTTELFSDGSMQMTLDAPRLGGGGTLYRFDTEPYRKGEIRGAPAILQTLEYDAGDDVDRATLTIVSKRGPTQPRDHSIAQAEEWILVGGVTVPRQHGTP